MTICSVTFKSCEDAGCLAGDCLRGGCLIDPFADWQAILNRDDRCVCIDGTDEGDPCEG